MSELADLLHRGGPVLWVLMMIGVAAGLVGVLCPVLVGAGQRVPVGVPLVLPLCMVLVGALGSALGHGEVVQALAYASPEMRGVLGHAGASMALLSEVAGLGGAAIVLGWFGVLAAGVSVRTRVSPELAAEYRVGAGVALTLGVLFGGLAMYVSGVVQVHEAISRASLEVMGVLVSAGLGQQKLGLGLALASVAVAAVAGLACVPVWPHVQWQNLKWSLMGLAGALGVAAGLHGLSRAVAAPLKLVWADAVLEGIDEVVPRRPQAVDARGKSHVLPEAWGLESVRVWRGGQWQPWGHSGAATVEAGRPHLLVAGPETPADSLFSVTRESADSGVVVLVQPPGALPADRRDPMLDSLWHRGLHLQWARTYPSDPAETGSILVHQTARGVVVMADGAQLAQERGVAGARSVLAAYMDGGPGRDAAVWLHPGPGWTLQDVVSLCLTGRDPLAPRTRGVCGVVGDTP